MMQQAARTARDNPYVGPQPFEESDQDYFFGRDDEAEDMLTLIFTNHILVLYAESAAGKTSLINAKLKPMLEANEFEVLPIARVGRMPLELSEIPAEIQNIFVFNALNFWIKPDDDLLDMTDMSLSDYLRKRESQHGDDTISQNRIIIFDQFEELFTTHADRWQERKAFMQQVHEALNHDPQLRVVFAIREDYIAQFDSLESVFFGKLKSRFRLEQLRHDAALLAVKAPAMLRGREFADGVAEDLVVKLSLTLRQVSDMRAATMIPGEFVEPVQLQLVCENIWKVVGMDRVITAAHVKKAGEVETALAVFYKRGLERVTHEVNISEDQLRKWFEQNLITSLGTRSQVYQTPDSAAGLPNAAIEILVNQRLLRREYRHGAPWYELPHDSLVNAIKRSNEQYWVSTRQRRSRQLVMGLGATLLLVTVAALLVVTQLRNQQLEQEFLFLKQNRAALLAAGGVIIPTEIATQDPETFYTTVTAIAILSNWEPVIQSEGGIEMVLVPPGCFYMGSIAQINEQPVNEVCFQDEFWIDRYEVTNMQFDEISSSNNCIPTSSLPNHPRSCVTWHESVAHCETRGGRLPTEAEWEYAARGPYSLAYPWGNTFIGDNVVYLENSESQTAPVGSREAGASWVGAEDMSGNVWEWVSTRATFPYPYDATDGREDIDHEAGDRELRGGSFNDFVDNLRAANRNVLGSRLSIEYVGFRCVRP